MKNIKYIIGWIWMVVSLSTCITGRKSVSVDMNADDVLHIINRVNQYWQDTHPAPGRASWDEAVYQTGNMAAYDVTANIAYKKYAENWAEKNTWMGATSNNTSKWKYTYGETDEYVLFGDWQVCFQTYIDLYNLDKDPKKIARAREVMEYQMQTNRKDYWWWIDGLYMVMPVMTKLYKVTGNNQYLHKLYEYYTYADSLIYDGEDKLYYRDAKYIYPVHTTASGKKDFWSRGNGWAFAALAKVLTDLPKNDIHRQLYVQRFTDMAEALRRAQQSAGHWTRSLLDPQQAPGFETSGTAFFTYGMLWGIRNGYLNKKDFSPVVKKAWTYLTTTALHRDGKIGYIQPIGERAIPGQVIDKNATSNFGVGAFLLAATEMYRFLKS